MSCSCKNKTYYLVLLLIQAIYAGMFILSKFAFNGGLNTFVFVFYRQLVATIAIAPSALIFERNRAPPLSMVVFCKIFMLSLFGVTLCLNLFAIGLVYTSPTLAAATTNTLPVITFVFALLFRMETVNLRTLRGIAKILGLGLCLAGVFTLAFYKGPHLKPLIHHQLLGHHHHQSSQQHPGELTWIKGCFITLTSNTIWGVWLVLQVKVMESYPSKLLFTALQCALSTIQSFFVAIVLERDLQKWKLHLDAGILAVAYTGIMSTATIFYLQAWCMEKKGPVFFAMSTPLAFIFTVTSSTLLLGESITLGSVLGGILLAGSLYSVLWGKSREQHSVTLAGEDDENKKEEKDVRLVVDEDAKKHVKAIL